jgi:hypothetical protein
MTESSGQPIGKPWKGQLILLVLFFVTVAIGIYSLAAPTAFGRWIDDVCHRLPIACWNQHSDYSYLYSIGKGTYALGFRALRIVCDWLFLVWFAAWLAFLFERQRFVPMKPFSDGRLMLRALGLVAALAWFFLSDDYFGAADGRLSRRSHPGVFGTAMYIFGMAFVTLGLALVAIQAIQRWQRYAATRRKPG